MANGIVRETVASAQANAPRPAEQRSTPSSTEMIGRVVRCLDRALVVETDGGSWRARRAASCLVEPEPHDLVVLLVAPTGEAWVLAVLERASAGETRLLVPGDATLEAPNGRLAIRAGTDVEISTKETLALSAQSLDISASAGHLAIERVGLWAQAVWSEIGETKLVGQVLHVVVDRVTERLGRVYRHVAGAEQVRAERIDYRAGKTMNLRGENTLMTAEQLVKVDGEQIHIG